MIEGFLSWPCECCPPPIIIGTYRLRVRCTNTFGDSIGAAITISLPDLNGAKNGITEFYREYNSAVTVTLTAPNSPSFFAKWYQDGFPFGARVYSIAIVLHEGVNDLVFDFGEVYVSQAVSCTVGCDGCFDLYTRAGTPDTVNLGPGVIIQAQNRDGTVSQDSVNATARGLACNATHPSCTNYYGFRRYAGDDGAAWRTIPNIKIGNGDTDEQVMEALALSDGTYIVDDKAWSSSKSYQVGQIVLVDQRAMLCIKNSPSGGIDPYDEFSAAVLACGAATVVSVQNNFGCFAAHTHWIPFVWVCIEPVGLWPNFRFGLSPTECSRRFRAETQKTRTFTVRLRENIPQPSGAITWEYVSTGADTVSAERKYSMADGGAISLAYISGVAANFEFQNTQPLDPGFLGQIFYLTVTDEKILARSINIDPATVSDTTVGGVRKIEFDFTVNELSWELQEENSPPP